MDAILDTSFLFALAQTKDRNHPAVTLIAQEFSGNLILPTVVLPEISYLLGSRSNYAAVRTFIKGVLQSDLRLEPLNRNDLIRISQLQEHYRSSQLDFVDTAIIAISERLNINCILTLDQRDFSIVRPAHCDYFKILP